MLKRRSKIFLALPFLLLTANLSPTSSAQAQDEDLEEEAEKKGLTPEEVLAAAPAEHWLPIPVNDLLVMTLPEDAEGKPRKAVIQLLPANLSGGHVRNIRKFAKARWWDGTVIYRVSKGFVTQFGGTPLSKPMPANLETVPESEYFNAAIGARRDRDMAALKAAVDYSNEYQGTEIRPLMKIIYENYGAKVGFGGGWPIGSTAKGSYPLLCRGSLSPAHYDPPDTGTGSELSVITGEQARGLDTKFGNIGRVIAGLEHLVNLPLGTEGGGFYADKSQHVPIRSIRLASELPVAEQPRYEYLASYSPSLLQYIAAHGGYGNICTVPVPVRKVAE